MRPTRSSYIQRQMIADRDRHQRIGQEDDGAVDVARRGCRLLTSSARPSAIGDRERRAGDEDQRVPERLQNTSSSKTSPRSGRARCQCAGLAAATRPETTAPRSSRAAGCGRGGRSRATAARKHQTSTVCRVALARRGDAARYVAARRQSPGVASLVASLMPAQHAVDRAARRRPARSWRPCGRARRSGSRARTRP